MVEACGHFPSWVGVLLVVALYALGVVLIRWHMVARPIRDHLYADREVMLAELAVLQANPKRALLAPVRVLLGLSSGDDANADQDTPMSRKPITDDWARIPLLERIFWTRGREAALWIRLDKAEMLLAEYWSRDRVLARLLTAKASLSRPGSSPKGLALAEQIEKVLPTAIAIGRTPASQSDSMDSCLLALLQAAMWAEAEAQQQDATIIDVSVNKLMWYVIIALLAISLVGCLDATLLQPSASDAAGVVFLLAGGVGGVLSRLAVVVGAVDNQDQAKTKQQLRWMMLFLGPLVGALAAWAGMFVLKSAVQLNIFGSVFKPLFDKEAVTGICVLLGFSERLFVKIASTVEDRIATPLSANAPAAVGTSSGSAPDPNRVPSVSLGSGATPTASFTTTPPPDSTPAP